MKKHNYFSFISILVLAGCSMTLPVNGQLQNTDENFSGTATGYIDGGGDIKIVSNKGAVCSGSFVYINGRQGDGIFNCEDGRTGPFTFVSTGRRGTGHGTIGGEKFTFTFGNM